MVAVFFAVPEKKPPGPVVDPAPAMVLVFQATFFHDQMADAVLFAFTVIFADIVSDPVILP